MTSVPGQEQSHRNSLPCTRSTTSMTGLLSLNAAQQATPKATVEVKDATTVDMQCRRAAPPTSHRPLGVLFTFNSVATGAEARQHEVKCPTKFLSLESLNRIFLDTQRVR